MRGNPYNGNKIDTAACHRMDDYLESFEKKRLMGPLLFEFVWVECVNRKFLHARKLGHPIIMYKHLNTSLLYRIRDLDR